MRKRFGKRIAGLLTALCVALSLMPLTALAAGETEITGFPFEATLVFSAENTEVVEYPEWALHCRTFKYSFTLTEGTSLEFGGEGDDTEQKPYFAVKNADATATLFQGYDFACTLSAGDYVVWIDDDGYDLTHGYGTLTAEVWIREYTPPSPSPSPNPITIPFYRELTFSPESGAFPYIDGDLAYWYTFTLAEDKILDFYSDNGGVHFYVFGGDNANIFEDEEIGDGHNLTLSLEAGAYTVVAEDCDDVGTAEVWIREYTAPSSSPITIPFNQELTFSRASGAFSYIYGDLAYWYTFTLTEDKILDFYSDNGGVHFYVFEGDDANIFEDEEIDDGHNLTLSLEAGAYTVVAEDCDWVGTAKVTIEPAAVTGVSVVDGTEGWGDVGTPIVGQILLANIQTNIGTIGGYPADPNASYKWYYADSTDTVLGTQAYYTVTQDNLGRVICVDVSVAGRAGTATWTAYGPVAYEVFNLTVDAGEGGAVSGAKSGTYGEGAPISVSAAPGKNYKFSGWTAEGVSLSDSTANPAVFEMPAGNVTLTASFTYKPPSPGGSVSEPPPPPVWTNPFEDMAQTDWFYGDVEYAVKNGLFEGTSATTFGPGLPMTRAMLVTVLWRLEKNPESALMYADFADVQQGSWYEKAVAWAAEKGFVSGYGEGLFGPDDAITREQLAAILYRYEGSPALSGASLEFADPQDASGWALDALAWATENGFLDGRPGNLLDPRGMATRAEVAAVLHRMLENGK